MWEGEITDLDLVGRRKDQSQRSIAQITPPPPLPQADRDVDLRKMAGPRVVELRGHRQASDSPGRPADLREW
jgi:hypothetical protein